MQPSVAYDGFIAAAKHLVSKIGQPLESIWLQNLRNVAQVTKDFIKKFPDPDNVLYAVKANADVGVIRTIFDSGVRRFDVTSLDEMRLMKAALGKDFKKAKLYFHNPVFTREQIEVAYNEFDVRNFCAIHEKDFNILHSFVTDNNLKPKDILISLRIKATSHAHDDQIFDHLFDLEGQPKYDIHTTAVPLLSKIVQCGYRHMLYFNISTQSLEPDAYEKALDDVATVVKATGERLGRRKNLLRLEGVNVGGGFSSPEQASTGFNQHKAIPTIGDFCEAIAKKRVINPGDGKPVPFYCEPGRALCWASEAVLLPVTCVGENSLNVADSVVGALMNFRELSHVAFPIFAVGKGDRTLGANTRPLHIRGGSPARFEQRLEQKFHLPENIAAGDYVLVVVGAYGHSFCTSFNGLPAKTVVPVVVSSDGHVAVWDDRHKRNSSEPGEAFLKPLANGAARVSPSTRAEANGRIHAPRTNGGSRHHA